jgi:hypothetical protein
LSSRFRSVDDRIDPVAEDAENVGCSMAISISTTAAVFQSPSGQMVG